ncbi:glycosyltransferase [Rufibacter sp. XAAS-G3-1]|uniref:glycosyltransferase n=1 Tax=Rufibacter sp. XAAS-G3-1 TaxID=2729134 RepID=UPI0021023A54|nr:glycosyltransferase [Rufibacter sp. XAAS-G3-1]
MNPELGGVCQAVRILITGLTKLGIRNEVVCMDSPEATYVTKTSFPTHAIGPGTGPWSYNPQLTPWLKNNLSKFTTIIVHGLWQYHGYATRKAVKQFKKEQLLNGSRMIKGIKLFVMPHGMLDPYFQSAPSRKIKALRNRIYWKIIESYNINKADGLLFTCEEECRLARQPFKRYYPKKESIIGLGTESPPLYSPTMKDAFLKSCPQIQQQPYILFLSRIHEKKGVDLLIKAYANILQSSNKHGFVSISSSCQILQDFGVDENKNKKYPKLVIAGPGLETTYGQYVQNLASANPLLKSSIYFTGMLCGSVKWGALYGCEAFILPSHQENFGIAVVEALACSKPVLITNKVNIWREIGASGAGLVADDTIDDVQKQLLSWLCLSVDEKESMQKSAKHSFKDNFDVNTTATRLVKAIT